MSESRTRRTVALFEDTMSSLEEIKTNTGVGTDNAAINDAVRFRARFAKRNPEEINSALSLWDQLKREATDGRAFFTEQEGKPRTRTKVFIPTLSN
jgi:hypothetical protein